LFGFNWDILTFFVKPFLTDITLRRPIDSTAVISQFLWSCAASANRNNTCFFIALCWRTRSGAEWKRRQFSFCQAFLEMIAQLFVHNKTGEDHVHVAA
jgi:hypothetical protein